MNVVLVYLRLYGTAAVDAFKAIGKNPWTLALPMALSVASGFARGLLAPLGMAGGFIYGLLLAAGFSGYLYFTGEVVSRSTTSVRELKKSFGVFFWSVIGLQFVLWIVDLALGSAMSGNPKGPALMIAITLLEVVALNAAPETIYVKGTRSGPDTIMASFGFLQENWIEWFIPNGLILAGAYWLWVHVLPSVFLISPVLTTVVLSLSIGALFHLVMVYRGLLYLALDGSTHRQRLYKYRTGA